MKLHPDLTIENILAGIRQGQVSAVGREMSATEAAEVNAKFQEFAQDPTKLRTLCAGCGQDEAMLDCFPCACGQFVCAQCREMETEGECNHEPPLLDIDPS